MSVQHRLRPKKGAVHKRKRVGRGNASGKGTTAGRGTKGAQSRSGYSLRPGFAGGNTPLHLRFPKRGFHNPNRVEYAVINVGRLQTLVQKYGWKEVTPELLRSVRAVRKNLPVKILGEGYWELSIPVHAHAFSKSAREKIESAGGTVQILPYRGR